MRLAVRIASAALLAANACVSFAVESSNELRLYAFDCGRIAFKDLGPFSDTGEWAGKSGELAEPCFLIKHPKGTLLWDSGLGDEYAGKPEGVEVRPGTRVTVARKLVDQLQELKLTPADVSYIAFSHWHWDHTGNADLFGASTWIVNKAEMTALDNGSLPRAKPESVSARKTAKLKEIDGDYDVFGDGSVMILKAPGHTPGHQVLEVKLAKSGVVVLSGDLYHTPRNRAERLMPVFNTSRADTLASMDRIERIVKNTHARFVIQHAPEDFATLPKSPAYLE